MTQRERGDTGLRVAAPPLGCYVVTLAMDPAREQPGEQFHIADERPPQAVAEMIRRRGYLPVWQGV